MPDALRLDDDRKAVGPPPQCVGCSKFVSVKNALAIPERGDYGTVYSYEFECASCFEKRTGRALRQEQDQ